MLDRGARSGQGELEIPHRLLDLGPMIRADEFPLGIDADLSGYMHEARALCHGDLAVANYRRQARRIEALYARGHDRERRRCRRTRPTALTIWLAHVCHAPFELESATS